MPCNIGPDGQIFLGCWGGDKSGIRRGTEDLVKLETPDILSAEEFTRFWIQVGRNKIKV